MSFTSDCNLRECWEGTVIDMVRKRIDNNNYKEEAQTTI